MREIQLYIESERVDLFGDESISITESIKNAKDVSKVFTTFSKQFTVPASKNNNRIFKHYYIANNFDARSKKDARIEINGATFRRGKIKLDGVDMRDNSPYAYRVTFYGSVVELKDILGEDKLPSLTALDIEKSYSAANIKSALTSLPNADGTTIPLISHTQRLYYDSTRESEQSGNLYYGSVTQGVKFDQLKYAIRLDKILEAIESKYEDINFASGSFFDAAQSTDITKLYMWCHRKKGEIEIVSGGNYTYGFASGDRVSNDYYEVQAQTDYSVREIDIVVDIDPATINARYDLILTVNDVVHDRYDGLTGDQTLTVELRDNFNDGDLVKIFIDTYEENVNFTIITMNVTYFQETQGGTLDYTESASTIVYNIPASFTFNIAENLPEMKIIDFLSSLFKMFNLVAYIDDNDDVYVEPLDTFYGTSEKDITKYIDIEKSQVDAALPYSEIFFKYKDTGTILAEQHLQEISEVEWGGIEYKDIGSLSGGIYKVEPDFHHAKYEKLINAGNSAEDTGIQVGYFVDDNEESYLGSPLILYVGRKQPNYNIGFLERNSRSIISTSQYINMPSNTETIDDETTNNIHFNAELSEYTNTEATETLFKRFYQSYIENIFNSRTRLVKVSAYLPAGDLLTLELSDIIVINNNKYRINSFDTNLRDGRTSFELINYYD